MSNASLAKECVLTQKVYSQVEYVFAFSTCSTKQFVNYVLVRCYIREFAIYVKVHFYVFLYGMDLITCVASVFGGEILGTKLCVKKSISTSLTECFLHHPKMQMMLEQSHLNSTILFTMVEGVISPGLHYLPAEENLFTQQYPSLESANGFAKVSAF